VAEAAEADAGATTSAPQIASASIGKTTLKNNEDLNMPSALPMMRVLEQRIP